MKLTKKQLKQIIKEELESVLEGMLTKTGRYDPSDAPGRSGPLGMTREEREEIKAAVVVAQAEAHEQWLAKHRAEVEAAKKERVKQLASLTPEQRKEKAEREAAANDRINAMSPEERAYWGM